LKAVRDCIGTDRDRKIPALGLHVDVDPRVGQRVRVIRDMSGIALPEEHAGVVAL
jgi:hypothetical protein